MVVVKIDLWELLVLAPTSEELRCPCSYSKKKGTLEVAGELKF